MIDANQFATADPVDLYARMRPDQRTAIANEFVRMLTLAGDPKVDELSRENTDTAARKAGAVARGSYAAGAPQSGPGVAVGCRFSRVRGIICRQVAGRRTRVGHARRVRCDEATRYGVA